MCLDTGPRLAPAPGANPEAYRISPPRKQSIKYLSAQGVKNRVKLREILAENGFVNKLKALEPKNHDSIENLQG